MRRVVSGGAGLSRKDFLRMGGAGLAGTALLGGGALAGCGGGGGDSEPEPISLGFSAVARNRDDRVTVPAGWKVLPGAHVTTVVRLFTRLKPVHLARRARIVAEGQILSCP